MNFLKKLELYTKEGKIPHEIGDALNLFYYSYAEAIKQNRGETENHQPVLNKFLDLITEQLGAPYSFQPYHESIRRPFDYYTFGLDFIRPLVMLESSYIDRTDIVDKIVSHLALGENVILLSNHQTEPDPQAISLLLEKTYPKLAEEMIFVAGHRVVTDPLAVPFSKGRNLLCIYSKNYIEHPPEQKPEKILHNRRTMKNMEDLLTAGGKCIYVAPSGGRDRIDVHGLVEVAPFDPQSIEMFRLIAKQAPRPTHFYPLALATYDLLPPPNSIQVKVGERRHASCTPIRMALGQEIDMHKIPGTEQADKNELRRLRGEYIWEQVKLSYQKIRGKR